ncbi:MFS general substrate transporter [Biscogniauxia mediterranea]|nr:MFS general substrate transporter [Biscogniauxia mediterranea]
MGVDIYWTTVFALVPLVAIVAGHRAIPRLLFRKSQQEGKLVGHPDDDGAAWKFRRTFLQVYLLVMGSEWLQGPYMYSLFRNEKNLDEGTVSLLYICMYASAAISAFFTGYVADKVGRRAACLVFCGIHSLASLSACVDRLELLILGRVLGGIGVTLLWTAFESWMVAEYNARGFSQSSSFSLSTMFGLMTTTNCITAVLAGVLGHCVVLALGSKADPFMVGVALDFGAAILILRTWNENRDNVTATKMDTLQGQQSEEVLQCPGLDRLAISSLKDGRIWALSFVSCCFEGTVFLLMFFWPGTLQEARNLEHPDANETIPYGVTFAAFMAVMALGALLFNTISRKAEWEYKKEERVGKKSGILTPTRLLAMALLLSASSLLIVALTRKETDLFAAFMLFEACNGVYVPNMAYHRGVIVSDAGRSQIYSTMNIPLFVFVIVALHTTGNTGGKAYHIPTYLPTRSVVKPMLSDLI